MARHLSRDYVVQSTNTNNQHLGAFLLAIFMRRVLNWTVVGHTNFNIDTVGTYLLAEGTGAGNRAGINFGAGATYEVSIPGGVHTVSLANVGKLLVLRSTANPTFNSGIFLITGANIGSNRYVVDYRSTDAPPGEAADSMDWWLYVADNAAPVRGATNAGAGYRGNGSSTTPRIILQSPHAAAYQVRICLETSQDHLSNSSVPAWSACPGYNGNGAGDFTGQMHTHIPMMFDSNSSNYRGAIGMGGNDTTLNGRYTFVGDDTGQAVALFYRKAIGASQNSTMLFFGIPDNEPSPLPADPQRIFAYGNMAATTSGQIMNNISFACDYATISGAGQGCGIGYGAPVFVSPSCWVYVSGNNSNAGPEFDSAAGDSVWAGATELLTVEVMAGGSTIAQSGGAAIFQADLRSMGTFPFVRYGRSNFGNFTVTTDVNKTWQHMQNGVYLFWGGPAVIP